MVASYVSQLDGKKKIFDGWSSQFSITKVNDLAINMEKRRYEEDNIDLNLENT